jgi:hypothetical protein
MARSMPVAGTLLALAVAGCGEPATYTRTGAPPEVAKADLEACQIAARDETWGYGPFIGGGFYGGRGWGRGWGGGVGFFMGQQRWDMERSYQQDRLTDFCMRNKGYALTPAAKS